MSRYAFTENYRGGEFKSFATGRVYPFAKTSDGSARRAACRQMTADDAAFAEAAGTRRSLAPVDSRTRAERIRDNSSIRSNSEADKDGATTAALNSRLADLNQRLAFTTNRGERAQIERLIHVHQQSLNSHNAKVEAASARQAQATDPDYLACVADATALVEGWQLRGDVAEAVVDAATAAVAKLKTDFDVEAYKATAKELRAAHNQDRQFKIAELKARQAELQSQFVAEIDAIRQDLSPPAAEPPAA